MQINGYEFTVGADPELFVSKDGEFVSAHDMVKGTKHSPFRVNKGAVQVDGMALEFNIDPASNADQFNENIEAVMQQLADMIGDHKFMDVSSVIFGENFLEDLPIIAKTLGCGSDYNAYSLDENEKPSSATLMRTAGGHVHIGGFFADNEFQPSHFMNGAKLSRILDEILGLPSMLWDLDDKRRELYGQAGCFRPKKYGMEYRTLSNKWIFSPAIRNFVYEGVKDAITLMFDGYEPNPDIQGVIDNSDRNSKLFLENSYVKKAKKTLF